MNDNSSLNPSISAQHHGLTAEAISRRAYEIWEQEGRPESRDLHHWLRAEQELLAEQQTKGNGQKPASNAVTPPSPAANSDTQPLQGTRAAAAVTREQSRGPAKRTGGTPPPQGSRNRV